MKSYQREIRDKKEILDPKEPLTNINEFLVKEISKEESKKIILEYEWLGTMGRPVVCYGLFFQHELIGALNFGRPSGPRSADICGKELRNKAICLERGACVHWTPKNTPSFFISRALKKANQDYGWEIFYAYSDEEAGEIGTIYQALNWYYIGKGVGRPNGRRREYFEDPNGKIISERTLTDRGLKKKQILELGWKIHYKEPKHKYVWFQGSKERKNELKNYCKYNFLQYPKRKLN